MIWTIESANVEEWCCLLHGTIRVPLLLDLTRRTVQTLTWSPSLGARLWQLRDELRNGAKSRVFTTGIAVALALWPFVTSAPVYFVTSFVDPAMRRYHSSGYRSSVELSVNDRPPAPIPDWLTTFIEIAVYTWPIALILAAVIGVTRISSGGCRLWPDSLSRMYVLNLFYRVRSEVARVENWRQIALGVMTGILLTILTAWII